MKKETCERCQQRHESVFHGLCAQCASDLTMPIFGRIEEMCMRHYTASLVLCGYEFLPTIDEWYPNFKNDTVAISPVKSRKNVAYIVVTGADDYYLIATFEGDDRHEKARRIRKMITEPVSRTSLVELGFSLE
jgi:hypothetical protein